MVTPKMAQGRRFGTLEGLAQREQQTLDILYKHGPSSARTIQGHIGDDLTNATVRSILRKLESKGYVKHNTKGNSFTYYPIEDKEIAVKGLFYKMVDTFFSGSVSDAMANFIDKESKNLNQKDIDELSKLIKKAKNELK